MTCSVAKICPTLCTHMDCRTPHPFLSPQNLPKFMSTELMIPSNHLIFCHPLLLLPSVFPRIRVFSNESALHIRWPRYWNFSFSISPSSEYLGFISFKNDSFDIFAVQGTLKSLLQHHNLKTSTVTSTMTLKDACSLEEKL